MNLPIAPTNDPLATTLRRTPYHVGVAARSMERGQRVLTDLFGLAWDRVVETEDLEFVGPDGPVPVSVQVASSTGGPLRVELCVGSLYPTDREVEFHHFGYWSQDVAADVGALRALGWEVEVGAADADGNPVEFAYLTKPGHVRVEVVDARRRPAYARRVGVDVPLHT